MLWPSPAAHNPNLKHMRFVKSLLIALLLATSSLLAQDMTTIHVDGNTAIHTDADEDRDVLEWADNNAPLNVHVHCHVHIDGQFYCISSEFTVTSGTMTRQEIAARIASDFRGSLVDQGMSSQDASGVVSQGGATVMVDDTPPSDPSNVGTPDNPIVTTTTSGGGPSVLQYVQ